MQLHSNNMDNEKDYIVAESRLGNKERIISSPSWLSMAQEGKKDTVSLL